MSAEIYSRRPVNKLASIVTSQSECVDEDYEKDMYLRESLVAEVQLLEVKLKNTPKKDPYRNQLGVRKAEIQEQLQDLKLRNTGVSKQHILIEVMKEYLSDFMYDKIKIETDKRLYKALGQKQTPTKKAPDHEK